MTFCFGPRSLPELYQSTSVVPFVPRLLRQFRPTQIGKPSKGIPGRGVISCHQTRGDAEAAPKPTSEPVSGSFVASTALQGTLRHSWPKRPQNSDGALPAATGYLLKPCFVALTMVAGSSKSSAVACLPVNDVPKRQYHLATPSSWQSQLPSFSSHGRPFVLAIVSRLTTCLAWTHSTA